VCHAAFSPPDIIPVTYYAFGEYGFPTFGFLDWPSLARIEIFLYPDYS
jgi:hypothetical protein